MSISQPPKSIMDLIIEETLQKIEASKKFEKKQVENLCKIAQEGKLKNREKIIEILNSLEEK